MLRFLKTRHNLRKPDLWGGETRWYTDEHGQVLPATSKFVAGHLRFHHFHRATDKDFHNHQFEFWTFPFQAYLEEILVPIHERAEAPDQWMRVKQIVPAFQWSYRDTQTPHRILGPCDPEGNLYSWDERHVRTVIWRGTVVPPGRTGFYLPTDDPYHFDFVTFEHYVAWQKHNDDNVQRAAVEGYVFTPWTYAEWRSYQFGKYRIDV